MPLSLDELSSILGAPAPAAGGAQGQKASYDWNALTTLLDTTADQYGVPRELARAVVKQESNWDINAVGDGGRARGWFQLHSAAAQDAGIDPARRHEPEQNILGGVRYLSQKLKQSKGNVDEALSRYNRGTPDYRGIGDPNYVQHVRRHLPQGEQAQPGVLTRAWTALGPRSAEAAERPRAPAGSQSPAGPLTVEGLEQLLGTPTPAPQATTTPDTTAPAAATQGPPAPPTARSTPEQDAAYRAWAAQQTPGDPQVQQPAQQPPQATTGPQGGVPLVRSTTPPLVDPRATQTGQSTMPSARVVDSEKSSTGQPPPAENKGLLADLPGWAKVGLATGTGIIGGVGGAAVGSLGGPVGTVAGEMGGSYLARKLNVALGLEEPGLVGDVASAALPGIFRGAGAVWRGALRQGVVPGTGAVRHGMAKEAVDALETRLKQGTPAADLWQLARQSNPDVATLESWRTAAEVLRGKMTAPGLTATDPGRLAMQDMLDMIKRTGGPVSIEDLDNFRRTLIPHLRDPGVQRLYGAILNDMENAATRGVSGAGTLRQAIARTRYEHSLDDLADLWKPGSNIKVTDGDQVQVFGKTMQNAFERKVHDNPLFAKAFAPEDLADIRATMKQVAKLTNVSLKPGGGLMAPLAMLPLAGMAGYAGYEQGGWKQGTAQALAVESFPYLMAMAMGTPLGRAAIRNAITQGGGRMGPAEMGGILTALREAGAFSGAIPTEEGYTARAPGGPARATD